MDFKEQAKEQLKTLEKRLKGEQEKVAKTKGEIKALEKYLIEIGALPKPQKKKRTPKSE